MKSRANKMRLFITAVTLLVSSGIVFGQQQASVKSGIQEFFNPVYTGLTIVALLLLIVIAVLSSVLKGLGRQHTNIEVKNHANDAVFEAPSQRTTWVRGASIVAMLLSLSSTVFGQAASEVNSAYPKPPQIDGILVMFILFIIFEFAIIIVLISSIKKLMVANGLVADAVVLKETAAEAKKVKARKPSFMQKWLTKAVPLEQEEAIVFDHEYDGIRELDNALPPWWLYGFIISIIFGVIYLFNFHILGTGNLQGAEYKQEVADAAAAKAEFFKSQEASGVAVINEENVTLLVDAASINAGKAIFLGQCKNCHLEKAEGKIGPNLTDEFWIYGGGIKNLFKTISNGTPKGMQPWKTVLDPLAIQQVASYVKSLKGTVPAGQGLGPQGDLWKDEPAALADSSVVKPDSAKVSPAVK